MPDHSAAYLGTAFVTGVCLAFAYQELSRPKHEDNVTAQISPTNGLIARAGPPTIVEGIEGCIGNTPLFRIKSLSDETGCEILGKAEFLNGAGQSSKDRVALSMIEIAEEQGILTPHSGDTIYEGTSGSTGISLATLARAKGYLAHICLPSDQAIEKSNLLLKLGAIVDRVPPAPIVEKDNFVNRARALAKTHTASSGIPSASAEEQSDLPAANERMTRGRGFFADQFENEANWRAHYEGTGPELYAQCGGHIDAFVAGAGTGGTISGVARFLKPLLPKLTVVLADPQGSGLFNRVVYGVMFDVKEREGTRRRRQVDTIVEGIGINRVTANFEAGKEMIDDAVRVTDAQALAMARWLVEKDGIFIGSSSAVNCIAAVKTARKLGPGHRIVTVLSDSGSRHLSRFWAKAGDVGGAVDTKLEDVMNARDEDFQ
ncbi:Tryptophan synthase beta subunit-like PLP-dependent enzymes superfamily [Penicillium samsonianum]|uniref:Tryptophan synthase beta subunit-like PLP-dependent enzymes superfamily n=1 Tax=Penicillium samsonianum TaxID=1882272 RepID=UPI0025471CD3|nr:Tryptophan synthase beta subunit-like PLP-dependent enzymes superfamily [Penicillium samsonianum]KAJ6128083.1 Tryptophan synthase beta subunit-like PLP-dependent enzymes superfamily [Penicillium samsonianum]